MAYKPTTNDKLTAQQIDKIIDNDLSVTTGEAVHEALKLKQDKIIPGLDNQVLTSNGTDLVFGYPGLGSGSFGLNNVILGRDLPPNFTSTQALLLGPNSIAGNSSISIGFQSTTANNSIALGVDATVLGQNSIAIGYSAHAGNGVNNTVVGSGTGNNLTNGNENTILGYGSGSFLGSGSSNIFIGANSGNTVVTGSNNIILGSVSGGADLQSTIIVAAGPFERFRITGAGLMGLGTTNPTAKLDVFGTAKVSGPVTSLAQPTDPTHLTPKAYVDAADGALQTQINNILSNTDPAALDSLTEIVEAFQNADSDLGNTIGQLITDLSDETAARIAGDQSSISLFQDGFSIIDVDAEGMWVAYVGGESINGNKDLFVVIRTIDGQPPYYYSPQDTNIDVNTSYFEFEGVKYYGIAEKNTIPEDMADDVVNTDGFLYSYFPQGLYTKQANGDLIANYITPEQRAELPFRNDQFVPQHQDYAVLMFPSVPGKPNLPITFVYDINNYCFTFGALEGSFGAFSTLNENEVAFISKSLQNQISENSFAIETANANLAAETQARIDADAILTTDLGTLKTNLDIVNVQANTLLVGAGTSQLTNLPGGTEGQALTVKRDLSLTWELPGRSSDYPASTLSLGYVVPQASTGTQNTFINANPDAITGGRNVFAGFNATHLNQPAITDAVAIGYGARVGSIRSIAIGSNSKVSGIGISIGYNAGSASLDASGNICIGVNVGTGLTTGSNNVWIGYNTAPTVSNLIGIRAGSNTITNSDTSASISGVFSASKTTEITTFEHDIKMDPEKTISFYSGVTSQRRAGKVIFNGSSQFVPASVVTANSLIFLTAQNSNEVFGVTSISPGSGFTIGHKSGNLTNVEVAFVIVETYT